MDKTLFVRPYGREGNPRHQRRNATLPSGTGQARAPPRQRRSKTAHLQDRRGARQRPSTPQDVADRAPPTPPGHTGPTNALASRLLGARAGATAGQGRARYPGRGLTNACKRRRGARLVVGRRGAVLLPGAPEAWRSAPAAKGSQKEVGSFLITQDHMAFLPAALGGVLLVAL